MEFEWDDAKNESNRAKHGIDFSLIAAFEWERASLRVDDRQNYGEERLLAYGPAGGQLYVVVFTMRADTFRIISLRRFGRKDQQYYESPQSN